MPKHFEAGGKVGALLLEDAQSLTVPLAMTIGSVCARGLFAGVINLERQDREAVDDEAGGLGVQWSRWIGQTLLFEPGQQRAIQVLGKVIALLIGGIYATLDSGQFGVGCARGSRFIFNVPQMKVGKVLGGHGGQPYAICRRVLVCSRCHGSQLFGLRLVQLMREPVVQLHDCLGGKHLVSSSFATNHPGWCFYGRTILIRCTYGGSMDASTERFLCVASYEKGHDFMRQCAEMGVRPTLLTLEGLRDADWPRDVIEEVVTMPSGLTREQIINTVSWLAREKRFDRIIAMDEFDQETAAQLREHTRIPGMGMTTTAFYRDKLAMRIGARESGFLVPPFCRVLNYDQLRTYMEKVPPPWLLKPRSEASAVGIRKIEDQEQLWRALDELGDRQSYSILEQFVPGEIFHVDSIVSERRVVFSVVHQYGRPPMQLMQSGGVFTTRTVDRASRDWKELTEMNGALAPSLGMVRGVTHAEYIRAHADGRYYFLEVAARVGGAFIADLVEVSTGVNLWREWAKLEVANLRGELYTAPEAREEYAGSVLCLAQTEEPDTSAFNDSEIVVRLKKHHHAGLIVRSEKADRVKELLEQYSAEFARVFLASMPPMDRLTPA